METKPDAQVLWSDNGIDLQSIIQSFNPSRLIVAVRPSLCVTRNRLDHQDKLVNSVNAIDNAIIRTNKIGFMVFVQAIQCESVKLSQWKMVNHDVQ